MISVLHAPSSSSSSFVDEDRVVRRIDMLEVVVCCWFFEYDTEHPHQAPNSSRHLSACITHAASISSHLVTAQQHTHP
jgi:hypothetical protein